MNFVSPGWFLLIPLLLAAGWAWPRLGVRRPLRVLVLLLGVLALADPHVGRLSTGMDLWVVIDRSDSTESVVPEGMAEWIDLLEKSKPESGSRLRTLHVASSLSAPDPDLAEMGDLGGGLSRLRLGIEGAAALAQEGRPSRILLFSDGYSTEPLDGLGEGLAAAGIPLDLRVIPPALGDDLRVVSLDAPQRVRPGESFVLSASLAGANGAAILEVFRDGEKLGSREVVVSRGKAEYRFAMKLTDPGAHRFEVRVRRVGDSISGNDVKGCWVELASGPRILLASRYPDDAMAEAFRSAGFEVDQPEDLGALSVGRLSGCRAVVIHDVPAPEFSRDFLEALDFFVREQGGGLLMVGGESSFGSGGYFESPIDALLPVSMELKTEHRKLSLAMAIVMDRSGSMSATVAGGSTKMDLANEGAGRAVELLGARDYVTVFAVDSSAHEMVPLLEVGANRGKILERVRRVQSTGGGIYVYTGLAAAEVTLSRGVPAQRHIILFSDAADSEEPGEFRKLIQRFRAAGGTVSVIGLGSPNDSDAAFLQEVALLGGGRMFFSEDATDLPNLFAQDAAAVARSAFLKESVGTVGMGGWVEVTGSRMPWLPKVDGYNLCYLRDEDTGILRTTDEYAAPLIAMGRRGLGRSMAITFPLGGEFADSVQAWPEVGNFIQTIGGWLAGKDVPRGIALRAETQGTELGVRLLSDSESWVRNFAGRPPRIALAVGVDGGDAAGVTASVPWHRIAPGELRAAESLMPGQFARGAVQVGESVIPFGPIGVGGDVEWDFDPALPATLRRESFASGGRELRDLAAAWTRPTANVRSSIVPVIVICLLAVALLDAFLTRMGKGKWEWQLSPRPRPRAVEPEVVAEAAKPELPVQESPPVKKGRSLESALDKVKRRRR